MLKKILKIVTDPFSNKRELNYLRYPALFIFWIINKIVFIVFKIFKLKLLNSPYESFGHQVFDLEYFFDLKKRYKFNYRPIILANGKYIANKVLLKYQKKKYDFIEVHNKLLCLILFYQRNYLNVSFDTNPCCATRNAALCYDLLSKNDLSIKLDEEDILKAKKILKDKNFKINNKLVILHVRDNSLKPFDGETYRNSKIQNFELAVNYLIKNNYQIIRIGNQGMDKNPFGSKVLDLSGFKFNEDIQLLHLYLSSICNFFIGTCSGAYKFAVIFKKPLLTVDMAPMSIAFPVAQEAIGIPKLYRNTKTKKIIKFEDLFLSNFAHLRLDNELKSFNLELIDTSPEDILEGVKEVEEYANSKKYEVTNLQKKFKNLFDKNCYAYYAQSNIANSFIEKYRELL